MIKLKVLIGIMISALFILSSCTISSSATDPSSNLDRLKKQESTENKNQPLLIDLLENAETIEETAYYKLVCSDFMFYYCIYDGNHVVVKTDGPFNRQPRISMADEYLVKVTLQAGTGLGTQWGYYYDINKDVFSRVFYAIHDQQNGMVAYGVLNRIIVRDIFDKTKYYQEITSFKEPLSEVAEPITKVEFVNDGDKIRVTYLTGSDCKEVTEIFILN